MTDTRSPELLSHLLEASEQEAARLRDPSGIGLTRFILEYANSALEKSLWVAAAEIAATNSSSVSGTFRRLLEQAGYVKCCDCGMVVPLEASSEVNVPGVITADRQCLNCNK
jgi:hypothetical protein